MATVNDLITEALNECNIKSNLESLTADELMDARNTLNTLMFAMPNLGKQLFRREEASHTFTQSVSSFTLPTTYYDLDSAYIRYNESDTLLEELPISEYLTLSNKNSQGMPQYYSLFYKKDFNIEVKLHPQPALVGATGYIFHYLGILNHISYTTNAENLNSPHNFYIAIKWALAEQLCNRYDVPIEKIAFITKMKKDALDAANATNVGFKSSLRIRSAF